MCPGGVVASDVVVCAVITLRPSVRGWLWGGGGGCAQQEYVRTYCCSRFITFSKDIIKSRKLTTHFVLVPIQATLTSLENKQTPGLCYLKRHPISLFRASCHSLMTMD